VDIRPLPPVVGDLAILAAGIIGVSLFDPVTEL
jgi:hypothetical protein